MSEDDIEEFDSIIEPVDDAVEVEDTEETSAEEEQPDVTKVLETNKKLYSRTKTSEAENKELKRRLAELEAQSSTKNDNVSSDSVDEKILRSTKGYDDDTLEKLRVVSKGLGVDLFKAEQDELFQDYLSKKQAEERKEKAKLSSSKGSQVSQPVEIAELSREDHKELFKETMSKVN